MINLSANLKKIRNRREVSQMTVAKKLGVTRQAVSQWELNITYPDIENLVKLSQIFHCDINELLF